MLLRKLAEAREAKQGSDPTLVRIQQLLDGIEIDQDGLVGKVAFLVESFKKYSKCSRVIHQYERDLHSLFHEETPLTPGGSPVGELVKRAFLMITEADRQYRSHTKRIVELERLVTFKSAEVKELRNRLTELETNQVDRDISILQEHALRDINIEKRPALNTLVEGYRKSESRRKSLEVEIIWLRSRTQEPHRPPEEKGNLFHELVELRQMVKELTVVEAKTTPSLSEHMMVCSSQPSPSEIAHHQFARAQGDDDLENLCRELFLDNSDGT